LRRRVGIAGGIESEIVDFLETALVCKLVSALEAVRVRAIASAELDGTASNGCTATAVETGTHVANDIISQYR